MRILLLSTVALLATLTGYALGDGLELAQRLLLAFSPLVMLGLLGLAWEGRKPRLPSLEDAILQPESVSWPKPAPSPSSPLLATALGTTLAHTLTESVFE